MSANPTLSNHHLHHNTPQKVITKIQQKPSANYNQYKVVNVNPSPSKPPLIAARPLAPLLPAAPTTPNTSLNHHSPLPPPTKPPKKPKTDNAHFVQHQQHQQQVRPGQPSTTTFTQDQLNQIAAALQQKNGQNGHSIGSFANGQFYQFIPIQPNGVKLQQPLIITPCSPHLLPHSKNSNIQPKPPQPPPPPQPQPQTPVANGDPPAHSQFKFQTVGSKSNGTGSFSAQTVAAPVQHQLSATSTNIQMLQQRLAEEEHRQEQLLKQLNEKKHQAKAKSPDKKVKCDAMDVDEWSHDDANTPSSVHSKKRGRPRLYAVDALTGKSIKGKLIENASLNRKSPKVAQQPQAQLQFSIYPSPSTSASSSSYSQQQNYIINQPGQFNPQFIPLNIVQPMIQEEKNEPAAQQQTIQTSTQSEQQSMCAESETSGGKEAGEMNVSVDRSVTKTPEHQDKKLVDTLKNLKSKVVLTHVIDGFVIKESTEPFPVKAGEVQRMCVDERTPPKSTSTPCNAVKREDQSNTSRLMDENSLLNTSATSQKSKAKSRSKQSPKKPRTGELDDKSAAAQPNAAAVAAVAGAAGGAGGAGGGVCKQEWPSGDPTEWNCEQVYAFVVLVAGEQVAEMFRSQDMDGSALSLIRDDHLVNTMGVKLGPALKIMSKFNEFKIKFSQSL